MIHAETLDMHTPMCTQKFGVKISRTPHVRHIGLRFGRGTILGP
jgi:hypothetical protein